MMGAISAYSYPNTSRSRYAARSTGVSRSSSTSRASESESASSARDAGPGAGSSTKGSGSHGPTYDSRRTRDDFRTLIESRVATVVTQAAGSSIGSS